MRKLLWLAVGFTAACFTEAYFAYGSWALLLGMIALIFIAGLFLLKTKAGKPCLLALTGFISAVLWIGIMDGVMLKPMRSLSGSTISGTVILSDYGCETRYGIAADGRIRINGKSFHTRLYLDTAEELKPGDRVTGTFEIRYVGPEKGKSPSYSQGKGIFVHCYEQNDLKVQRPEKIPLRFYPAVIRKNISQLIERIFPENTAGFAGALLLGEDDLLPSQTDSVLKESGIRHVVAVSGLHVSILCGLIYAFCGRKKGLTAAIGIPVLVLFAAIAGFTPSVCRACIMQSLMILALLLNRDYDSPTALSFAVLVLLAGNPMTVTSVSFQMSVGSIIGILLISEKIRSYMLDKQRLGRFGGKTLAGRFCRFLSGSVSVTLGAMLFTVPLCSFYFGTMSLIGVLTNLLTLWAITLAFYGIIISCIMGLIWIPAGTLFASLTSFIMDYCLGVARLMAKIPFASVYTDNIYISAWVILCYVLICIFAAGRKKHPWVLTGCIFVSFAASVLCARLEPETGKFFVSVLDVGQGQCVLMECNDHAYMVDCGSEKKGKAADVAVQNMWSHGIDHLDGLILTHYDSDHVNGTEKLLESVSADQLYLPDSYDENGLREEITAQNEGNITFVTQNTTVQLPEGTLTIIPAKEGTTDNESGLCVLFQPKGYDILITGDRGFSGEKELMEEIDLPRLELLVVGHHGSKYSTSLDFLQETRPAVAAISVGKGNHYGHPARETLERLKLYGTSVFRTDLDKTVTFRGKD